MSDDRLGGGGTDDKSCKAIDQFKKDGDDTFNNPWRAMYFGVYRSNYLLSSLDDVEWNSEESKTKSSARLISCGLISTSTLSACLAKCL